MGSGACGLVETGGAPSVPPQLGRVCMICSAPCFIYSPHPGLWFRKIPVGGDPALLSYLYLAVERAPVESLVQ